MFFSKRLLIMLIILMLAVAACGGDDDGGDDVPSSNSDDTTSQQSDGDDNTGDTAPASGGDLPADAAAAFDGMAPGTYMLEVTGELTGSGGAESYTGQDLAIDYDPAPNNPNDEGFAQLRARVDAGQDENGEPVYAEVDIRIPYGTAPGVYEVIAVDNDDTSGSVQAEVGDSGFGPSFNDAVSGTVTLVEFGDVLTASFDFTSQELDASDEVEGEVRATGRVFQIPFDPNSYREFAFGGPVESNHATADGSGIVSGEFDYDDFTNEVELTFSWTDDNFDDRNEVSFRIRPDITPGEYEVTQLTRDEGRNLRLADGQQVAAYIDMSVDTGDTLDYRTTSLSGTLTIEIDDKGEIFGTFNVTGTDDAGTEATAEGMFEHLRNSQAQLFVREDAG